MDILRRSIVFCRIMLHENVLSVSSDFSSIADELHCIHFFRAPDSNTRRVKMQVKVVRPNPELGVLAHMAGVVKVNPSGTLQELRQDISRSLPGHLGSVQYLLLSRKFKVIDPRTESQLIVSGVYKQTIYVKVFHGAGEFLIKVYFLL